jgi:hypothetical protein
MKVTGTVKDSNGEPIPEAKVVYHFGLDDVSTQVNEQENINSIM